MKRLLATFLVGAAVVLGTATAEAHDRSCNNSRSSYRSYSHSHYHGYSRSHSSGYCRPQSYYYRPSYSYNCQPRYYSPPSCYRSHSGFSISVPGFGFFFRR